MFKRKSFLFVIISLLTVLISGCSFSEKASTLKDDIINITTDQVSRQLENSLNQELPGVQVNTPGVIKDGQVNWEELQKTELANYVFYSIGDYEFRAILSGDGKFRIERINHSNGETFSYAEFNVEMADGKFQVTAK